MRTTLRTTLLIPVALAALVLSAPPALAIEGGAPDGNQHPNVGLLAFDVDGHGPTPPLAFCSGSVISDHAFLTAAHCIDAPFVPSGAQWVVTLESGSPANPILPGGYYPSDFPGCCALLLDESQIERSTGTVVDPDFDAGTAMHDLAVVIFPQGTFAGVRPVELPHVGALDHLQAASQREGPQFTLVGYGTEMRDGGFYVPGYRKTARASFRDLTPNWLVLGSTPDGLPFGGAASYGDSGGPKFLGGTNIEAALQSEELGQRLDTSTEQQFLAPYLSTS